MLKRKEKKIKDLKDSLIDDLKSDKEVHAVLFKAIELIELLSDDKNYRRKAQPYISDRLEKYCKEEEEILSKLNSLKNDTDRWDKLYNELLASTGLLPIIQRQAIEEALNSQKNDIIKMPKI